MSNIALVVLDTLRKDAFEEYFDWLPGAYYPNAWSPSHWTVPVHGSLFTGKYPSEIGVHAGSQEFNCDEASLAELLHREGYHTKACSCNMNISSIYGFDRGFDEFDLLGYHNLKHWHDPDIYDWSRFMNENPPSKGKKRYLKALKECWRSDCATLRSIIHGIDLKFDFRERLALELDMGAQETLEHLISHEFGDREFLFLNLLETHAPYQIPEKYKDVDDYEKPDNPLNEVSDTDLDSVQTRYANSAEYLSDIYREIFDELNENFDYIVTLSDHGELLGEHGFYEHAHGLYPELVNVPLTIHGPEIDDEKNPEMVSLLDVHRTVLALAGIDSESRGRNLLNDVEPQEFLSEYHGFPYPERHRKKMEDWGMSSEEIERYMKPLNAICIPDEYYGYETNDSFEEVGECPVDNPKDRMEGIIDTLDKRETVEQGQKIPESVEESLDKLGYI